MYETSDWTDKPQQLLFIWFEKLKLNQSVPGLSRELTDSLLVQVLINDTIYFYQEPEESLVVPYNFLTPRV